MSFGLPAASKMIMNQPLDVTRVPRDPGIRLRVVSLNVEFGARTTTARLAEALEAYRPDVLGLCEAPAGDWASDVAARLGLEYVCVGRVSSAHHVDKYKALLSRTPLRLAQEQTFQGQRDGWNPASIVWAETVISGVTIGLGSLHICENKPDLHGRLARGHSSALLEFLNQVRTDRLIIMGDFNNRIGDPSLELLRSASVRSVWPELKADVENAFTYSAVSSERLGVIDHIMIGKTHLARAIAGGIVELQHPVADHKPIWAEIEFSPDDSDLSRSSGAP